MSVKTAYKIWGSDGQLGCGRVATICAENVVPASLVPYYVAGTDTVAWNVEIITGDTWSTVTGARNGILVTQPTTLGGIPIATLYDVQADATSDEDENSPYNKLAVWLGYCCGDCDPNVIAIDGEYNGTYPALAGTSFCYNVTITGVTENPTAYALTQIALTIPNDYLASDVKVVSYNAGTDVLVVNFCSYKELTSTGYPLGFPASNASLGTTLTWAFASA